jgi:hypothetical protein
METETMTTNPLMEDREAVARARDLFGAFQQAAYRYVRAHHAEFSGRVWDDVDGIRAVDPLLWDLVNAYDDLEAERIARWMPDGDG